MVHRLREGLTAVSISEPPLYGLFYSYFISRAVGPGMHGSGCFFGGAFDIAAVSDQGTFRVVVFLDIDFRFAKLFLNYAGNGYLNWDACILEAGARLGR